MRCPRCKSKIDLNDNYCRYCGISLEDTPKKIPWYYKGWFVLIAAFIFLGPFALPLLWNSPDFKKQNKKILTAVIIIYTLILMVIPYLYLGRIYSRVLLGKLLR